MSSSSSGKRDYSEITVLYKYYLHHFQVSGQCWERTDNSQTNKQNWVSSPSPQLSQIQREALSLH